ncbi:citramalate synthase [Acetivibrio sp. MSJd-27]|uniref:citramalate synthase n=1 Tax=Acetivibrio sp. MSJd-27 TaxID=2841523 RepID=UPI001C1094B0|nr:citramalate synthase [Acetivibrio sp. MSJd-27]MBU5451048.1 citramalate synthase [Acetivibrio sp. MSJd-27]
MGKRIYTLDSTLRDGMQSEKISFSVADKIKIVKYLDELGVDYIEAGNPGSNVKDRELFRAARNISMKHAQLVAFGSTCKVNTCPQEDENLNQLLEAETQTVVIFGKASALHVSDVLNTTLEENLRLIQESIAYLVQKGKRVFFDAEHFFDGYKENSDYALQVLLTAQEAGAETIVLCDTSGGCFPNEIADFTRTVTETLSVSVGIHTHNDAGMAVANTVMGVLSGANHIQGTLNGIGERCGNANLSTCIANLQLKYGCDILSEENMKKLTPVSRAVAEISNISISGMPYVSKGAFSHKSGMHIDAVLKNSKTFEHIAPEVVGNARNFLISEMAGKSAIISEIQKIRPDIEKNAPETAQVLKHLKDLEYKGYQFEGAGASLELAIRKVLNCYQPHFELMKLNLVTEQETQSKRVTSSALIKVNVNGREEITAAEGNGPVNALDTALRKALNVFYPVIDETHLTDYKVRVLDSKAATGATVRVLIETTDGADSWTTIGVSTDVIEASKIALTDAVEYKLLKSNKGRFCEEGKER